MGSSVFANQYAAGTDGMDQDNGDQRSRRSSMERTDRSMRGDSIRYMSDRHHVDHQKDSQQATPVPIWLCVLLVVSYIIGGAFLFSDWEDWKYSDSAYFCFITLTTIGFGDFVPAQRVNRKNAEISIALCSLYLLFGIALLAMSFNLVQEEVIGYVKAIARHLGILKDDRVEYDSD